MRQINLDKILEREIKLGRTQKKIRRFHEDYCYEKILEKCPEKTININRDDIKKLCCENPFVLDDEGNIQLWSNGNAKIRKAVLPIIRKYSQVFKNNEFEDIYKYFRYARYRQWNGVSFIEEIGIRNCPYCGMQYMTVVGKGTRKKAEASLDHFVCKSRTEMLALNLYNLVPVCNSCNSKYKLADKKAIVNPYFTGVEDNINFVMDNIDFYMQNLNNQKLPLKFYIENKAVSTHVKRAVDNHKDVLKLTERYGQFEGIAKSIVKKHYYFGNSTAKFLKDGKIVKNLLLYQDLYDDNEPFSKFKNDIWDECENWGKKK